jgi:hypothetical protein
MADDRKAREAALKKLIRDTVDAAGGLKPDEIPHKVKARLKGQAIGDLDVEGYLRDALNERKKR